jgi:hypothetical protein
MTYISSFKSVGELKSLSDGDLLTHTKSAIAQEKKATLAVLKSLQEVQHRMLYASRGYESLHSFCVKELGYSDGEAHRRLSAMRLLTELPEIESKIKDNKLSLSTASQIQNFFRGQSKSKTEAIHLNAAPAAAAESAVPGPPLGYNPLATREDKLKLVTELEGKSRRDIERHLVSLLPESAAAHVYRGPEERAVSATQTEIRITVDQQLYDKLKRIGEVSGHTSMKDIIAYLASRLIKQIDPVEKAQRNVSVDPAPKVSPNTQVTSSTTSPAKVAGRYIPSTVRHYVWMRDKGSCAFIDGVTKRRCGSTYKLEIDHITPFAKGGTSLDAANLRLLCKAHNRLEAVRAYGKSKVAQNYTRRFN